MNKTDLIKNRYYKHFKGGVYVVKDIIYNAEADEPAVLYESVLNNGKLFTRTTTNFFEVLDKGIYPEAVQKYRMELIPEDDDGRALFEALENERILKLKK